MPHRANVRRERQIAALILLALMFLQMVNAAKDLSAVVDEGFHITSGYEYLRTGRLRLLDEHTPVVKALMAWPLFFVPDLLPPEQSSGYVNGDLIRAAQETVLAYRPLDRVIVACRVPVILLTLVLAATIYRWAAAWFGPSGGLLALILVAFDPNILAHGSLATTDLGATAFIFWAVLAFAQYLRHPKLGRWLSAALFLGLAQGAKLTAALLIPVLGLWGLLDILWNARFNRLRALGLRLLAYGSMLLASGVVLWALYGFEVRPLFGIAGHFPIPAASHMERWLRLRENLAYGREAFLLGQNRMHGWWQYFPIAFVLKTPLPTLLMMLLMPLTWWMGCRRRTSDEMALLLFPLTYATLSLTSTINIGYRHLLPLLPFIFVSLGRFAVLPKPLTSRFTFLRFTLYALLLWLSARTLWISPHYLAYFNDLAGGPENGYRFLADSNTEWGQTLKALAVYQKERGLGTLRLSIFTFLDPAAYGVQYEPIAPMRGAPPVFPRRFNPEPGLYAISATTLDGVPLAVPSMYDWFRHREPMAKVGYVMFIYEVAETSGHWVAQCTTPVVPLTPDVIEEGFGSSALRRIQFDCDQSWVFPAGGAQSGWYVRTTLGIDRLRWPRESQHLEWWPAWVGRLPLRGMRLSYVDPISGILPPFAIWEWTDSPVIPPIVPEGGAIALEGVLAFLGYDAPLTMQSGETLEVLTYWRVLTRPARLLSLMLHLTGDDGIPIAVGDGLGIPVDQWEPEDVIVQRHILKVPEETRPGAYRFRSGAYWLDDMQHLQGDFRIPVIPVMIQSGPLFSIPP